MDIDYTLLEERLAAYREHTDPDTKCILVVGYNGYNGGNSMTLFSMNGIVKFLEKDTNDPKEQYLQQQLYKTYFRPVECLEERAA